MVVFYDVGAESNVEYQLDGAGGYSLSDTLRVVGQLGLYADCKEKMKRLEKVVHCAYEEFNVSLGVEAAQEFGKDFIWPPDVCVTDGKRFRTCGCSITRFAQTLFDESEPNRLNGKRVKQLRELDPHPDQMGEADWERLVQMATFGVDMYTTENFIPRTKKLPLRKTYTDVAGAINISALEDREEGLVFLLHDTEVELCTDELHFSDMHWVPKVGKPAGRAICDMSSTAGGDALNSEEVKRYGIETYGVLRHPTVVDYASMIQDAKSFYAREIIAGDELVFFQIDILKAFKRMPIRPSSVRKTAIRLDGDIVMFYISGFFGWTLFPYCFGVITRTLLRLARLQGIRFLEAYVDDFTGVTLRSRVAMEAVKLKDLCQTLLGEETVNEEKTVLDVKKIDIIGWEFNLEGGILDLDGQRTGTVNISFRNLKKILHGFLSLPADWLMSRNHIERLASWMSRYSGVVLPQLRPLSAELFSEICGLNRNIQKRLGMGAQNAIWIWRSFLCASVQNPEKYVRSLTQLLVNKPSVLVNFDASLNGLGIRLFHLSPEGATGFCFCVVWIDLSPAKFRFSLEQDSSFQNSAEFMAVSCALFVLSQMGFRNMSIRLCGDSVSALTWATTRAFRRGRSFRTACFQTHLSLSANMAICSEFDFIKGDLNYDADFISRNGETGKEIMTEVRSRYPPALLLCVEDQPEFMDLLRICDPESDTNSLESLCAFWSKLHSFVDRTLDTSATMEPPLAATDQFASLQLFVSAAISNRPDTCQNKREAWTLEVPAEAAISEILRSIWDEYGVQDGSSFRIYAPRIRVYLSLPVLWHRVGKDIGLLNGDVLQLVGGLLGGMEDSNKRKALNIVDTTLTCWREFMKAKHTSIVEPSVRTARPLQNDSIIDLERSEAFTCLMTSTRVETNSFLRPGDLERVHQLRGVVSGTQEAYNRAWMFWVEFIKSRNQLEVLFLRGVPVFYARIMVANFVIWLNKEKGRIDSQITAIFSGIRSQFLRVAEDISIFSDPMILYAKKAFKESARDSSVRHFQRIRLPACSELLDAVKARSLRSIAGDSITTRLSRALVYRACIFMYNFGLRFCNVSTDTRSERIHAIRRCDVVIHDITDRRFTIPQYHNFLCTLKVWGKQNAIVDRVSCLVFFLHSSKVHKKVGRVEILAKRNEHETIFLSEMVSWILWESGFGCDDSCGALPASRYEPNIFIFSRAHTAIKAGVEILITAKLTRKQVSTALKGAAQELGLNPSYFASHCLKIGSLSEMSVNGEGIDVIRRLGDHSENSTSTFLYQHTVGRDARPLLLASSGKGLTVRDINLICPLRHVEYEELANSSEITGSLVEIDDNSEFIDDVHLEGFDEITSSEPAK